VAPKGWCGTNPWQSQDARLVHDENAAEVAKRGKRIAENTRSADIGNLAVIEDDGTVLVRANTFDISKGTKVLLTPASGGGFGLSSGPVQFEKGGSRLSGFVGGGPGTPTDDGYAEVAFASGFRFPFYGESYDKCFVGTNGFVTFGSGDFNSPAVVSAAALQLAEPRIAAFWADLDVTNSSILVKQSANSVVITWKKVQKFNDAGSTGSNTFQIQLFADGRIALVYKKLTDTAELIGVAPGGGRAQLSAVNFKSPGGATAEAPFERFSDSERVDSLALTAAFYRTHGDDYDFVYTWTDFPTDLGSAFAFYMPIANSVQGIGQQLSDNSREFGSDGRLQGLLNLNRPDLYPSDPSQPFLGLNSALAIFGQEQGHRWLAYVRLRGTTSLLGRQVAHWSPYFNTESTISSPSERHSSCAEGNAIRDNGNGTFTTTQSTIDYFSPLDLYLMGLRSPAEVPASFLVTNASGSSGTSPQSGLTLRGTKQTVTIDDIISSNGARVPDSNASQKEFRAAWILLVRQGTAPSQSTLNKLETFRSQWEAYFNQSLEGRGHLSCELVTE